MEGWKDKGDEGGMVRGGSRTGNIKRKNGEGIMEESYAKMPSKLKRMAETNKG